MRYYETAALAFFLGSLAAPAGAVRLDARARIEGFAMVKDLTATVAVPDGELNLTWTEPQRFATTNPLSYEIRASSLSQISNDAQFNAAKPLSAFTSTPVPPVGPAGGAAALLVQNLTPGVTYYFAIRGADASAPSRKGGWLRLPPQFNANNFAPAGGSKRPDPISDLAASRVNTPTEIRLTWTAPEPQGTPAAFYRIKMATVSVAELGGDTTAWYNLAASTTLFHAPAGAPGVFEVRLVTGVPLGTTFYFGVKTISVSGAESNIDLQAKSVVNQVRLMLDGPLPLFASTGTNSGDVNLTWAQPFNWKLTPPFNYRIRVSTLANIENDAQFAVAKPLSEFSSAVIPPVVSGGSSATLTVGGLVPGVTHYFAVAMEDSAGAPFRTRWFRDLPGDLNVTNFAPAHFIPRLPDSTTNFNAVQGPAEGGITLKWTAALNQNFVPISHYDLRIATFSPASLGNDTTAWYNAAISSQVIIPAQAAGSTVTLSLSDLFVLTTFYFGIRTVDIRNEISLLDLQLQTGVQVSTRPLNFPPPTPANFAGIAGFSRATLSWTDLTPAQKRAEFDFYQLYRSTEQAAGFVVVATTTANGLAQFPLTAFTTYYFKLSAREQPGGLESVLSSTISVLPFSLPPDEPIGISVSRTSETVSFSWSPVTRFSDGTPFVSTGAPIADELIQYRILRSTDICNLNFVQYSTASVAQSSFTNFTGGLGVFYQIRAVNTVGASTPTLVFSNFGDQHFFLTDCQSRVTMSEAQATTLLAANNGLGADIQIRRNYRSEDAGGTVLRSAEFIPTLSGGAPLKNFYLSAPARIVLRFEMQGGGAVPAGLGVLAQGPGVAATDPQHLGMYWHNGAEYKKMYGKVSAIDQTVQVQSPNLGLYQIRSLQRAQSVVFDLSNISSRVITPNNDGLNDILIFTYDPGPRNVVPTGQIFDTRGQVVASMGFGLVPNTMVWDGRMNGRAVTSGVYVYQLKGDGKVFNGTIVVAR